MGRITRSPQFWAVVQTTGGLAGALAIAFFQLGPGQAAAVVIAAVGLGAAASSLAFTDINRTQTQECLRTLEDAVEAVRVAVESTSEISELRLKLQAHGDEFIAHGNRHLQNVLKMLKQLADGVIPLSREEYYNELHDGIKTLGPSDRLLAINVIDEARWLRGGDPYQRQYLRANLAAAKRGAHIERVFIARKVLQEQKDKQIDVHVIWEGTNLPAELRRDIVVFDAASLHCAYEDFAAGADRSMVTHALKYVSGVDIEHLRQTYQRAKELSVEI